DCLDNARQRFPVGRWLAAHAVQDLAAAHIVEHPARVVRTDRSQSEGDVSHQLDQPAAQPEGHQFAAARVGDGPDDDFGAAANLLLDLHAVDPGLGIVVVGALNDLRVDLARLLGALDASDDAASVGLMQDVRRLDLHNDREAQFAGDPGRLVGVGRQALAGRGDAVCLAELPRGRGGKGGASLFARCVEQLPNSAAINYHAVPSLSFRDMTEAVYSMSPNTTQLRPRSWSGLNASSQRGALLDDLMRQAARIYRV